MGRGIHSMEKERQLAREKILMLLCFREAQPDLSSKQIFSLFEAFSDVFETPIFLNKEERSLFEHIITSQNNIDLLIEKNSKHWKMNRMNSVDRNLLRLATYELCIEKIFPPSFIIHAFLELAKSYSTKEACSFIHGVLNGIQQNQTLK